MANGDGWRVAIGDQQSGPHSPDQLRKLIVEGRVPASALIWKTGMSEWRSWRQVSEFSDLAAAAGPPPSGSSLGTIIVDCLMFRRMVVPLIIQAIFWIGVVVCVGMSLYLFADAISKNSFTGVLSALLFLVIGPLQVRILCEMVIVIFRISETLTDIKNKLPKS